MHSCYARNISLVAAVILWAVFAPHISLAGTLPLKTFTSADGLGSSYVSFEMRDSRGFLWFCTRDGLSRFDGSRFVTYRVGNEGAPPGIEGIFETSKGIYWITTTGGLYRYDPSEPIAETSGDTGRPALNAKLVSDVRGVFYEDRQQNLWFGSDELYQLHETGDNVTFEKFALNLPANPEMTFAITAIIEGSDNSLWMISSLGLLRRLPDGRIIFYVNETPRSETLTSLIEDAESRIWIGRSTGVSVLKPESIAQLEKNGPLTIRKMASSTSVQPHSEDNVKLPGAPGEIFEYAELKGIAFGKYLYSTSDGHIWISTGNGLVEFDGSKFAIHNTNRALLNGVGMIVEDSTRNLWLALSTGLLRFERNGLTSYDAADGMNTPLVVSINETRDERIYVATTNLYLSVMDRDGITTVHPNLPPNARSLWTSNAALEDSRGEWWFLTNEHLYHFAPQTDIKALARQTPLAVYDSRTGLKGDQVFHIFEDSHGDIWVSNRDASPANYGLARWDRNAKQFYTFSETDGFPSGISIASFAEDKAGNMWLGAYEEGGLFRYSNGKFTRIEEPGVPKGVIPALLMDRMGRLWAASSLEGLCRIDDPAGEHPVVTHFTTENGMASNNVRSLTEDNFGNIYAGTARGVNRLSADSAHIRHYSVSDGLSGDFVNAAFRDSRGTLWFGTPNGLSKLAPEPDRSSNPPPILLGGIRIAGESRSVPELGTTAIGDLDLDYTQNNLQIDYFTIDFNAGGSPRYQYMLEGADKGWSEPVQQPTVSYANLGAGGYRFLVRALNTDGVVSAHPATVTFSITPPFWRRWWFIGGVFLFLGFAVFSLDRYRLTKTRQVEMALGRSIESETRFRTLAETASDAIITIDAASNIVFVNEAVENVFGYTAIELIGQKLTVLMPEGLRPNHESGLERYVATDQKRISWSGVELPGRHKSGATIPLELSFGEFELNGERYFTGVARDISERKRAEDALRESREERFRELERVRTRIATDLHDDIGASLTQIAVLSEVARRESDGKTDQPGSHLQKISTVSVELVQAMGDIVWAINPRNDTLPNLIKRMRRFASDIFSAGKIHFDLETPELETDDALGANIRREVFAIFKECVNNIARHSGCTNAAITLVIADDVLQMRFTDNGCGFDAIEILSKGFSPETGGNGLINIRRRAAELGGSCNIISEPGKGTDIRLDIPLPVNRDTATSHVGG